MIKYLKKLWKKCFSSVGDSRIKEVRSTSTSTPVVILRPKPLHCKLHTRFKKSCPNCLTAVGVK